ncbi:lipoyl(octanoyl) transferase LipB [Candidatus Pelagibacter sp.]|uniref:lipoyl(octanoyl) transferase LipB n=1 Tax=Candidatus Pelagibacter sp. TaxID=2024849 RepID=UPI003F832448
MTIEIKKSQNPVKYEDAISFMENRLKDIDLKKVDDLIWVLEHDHIYTSGTSYNENEIIDKSIDIIKTNRGGKITYHGPGQLICYFVIDLKKGKKDIRKFISVIEKSIIETLKLYNIDTFADKENIGIWYNDNSTIKKVAAIGVRVTKWIAYHGFSININNNLKKYDAIIPCGIKDKGITNLKQIKDQNYDELKNKLIEIFKTNLKNSIF